MANRPNMNAQLTPIFPSDSIRPGIVYFARLDAQRPNDINSWWIVLRCPEEVLPQPFLDSKEPQARVHPFWVIGKGQFVWLERDSLFLLHSSQKAAFGRTGFHDDFTALYDLAKGQANPLAFFDREIAAAGEKYFNRSGRHTHQNQTRLSQRMLESQRREESLFLPLEEEASDQSVHDGGTITDTEPRQHKIRRQRTSLGTPSSDQAVQITKIQPLPASSVHSCLTHPQNRIKTEAEEIQFKYASVINAAERVRVFIGTIMFVTAKTALERSPVLTSYIQRDEKGMFIMHPKLNETDPDDFLSMLDFMQTGSYRPRIVEQPHVSSVAGQGQSQGANTQRTKQISKQQPQKSLEGKKTAAEYSREVIRASRLYVLARSFGILNLNNYIFHRVIETQYQPYSLASLITVARTIFKKSGTQRAGYHSTPGTPAPRTPGSGLGLVPETGRNPTTKEEPFEQWVINMLAENFKEIMQNPSDRDLFWVMERETVARCVVAEIYGRCAENYRKVGGIPVMID